MSRNELNIAAQPNSFGFSASNQKPSTRHLNESCFNSNLLSINHSTSIAALDSFVFENRRKENDSEKAGRDGEFWKVPPP